jgi:hypothetical protein
MIYYIIFGLILATFLLALFVEFIHLPHEKFRKNLKIIIFIFLFSLIGLIMTRFPHVISVIPAVFLILYRWRFLIGLISKIFLYKRFKRGNSSKSISKSEALEILGLDEQASKHEILKRYQELMKKNHPDIGGSEWVTKKLNQARETLLG